MDGTEAAALDAVTIAQAFVSARANRRAVMSYPGPLPETLAHADLIQSQALRLDGRPPAGWKIGRIQPPQSDTYGDDRLSGPIFADAIVDATDGARVTFEAIEGGFCAVEGEVAFLVGQDASASRRDWTAETVAALVAETRFAVEMAGSPFSQINDLGPGVTASDFGNNAGLFLGGRMCVGPLQNPETVSCRTFIDGVEAGRGRASDVLGGPLGALAWLASHLAARGLPLKQGQWVSTGAITGVHRIFQGQSFVVEFDGFGSIAGDILGKTEAAG